MEAWAGKGGGVGHDLKYYVKLYMKVRVLTFKLSVSL